MFGEKTMPFGVWTLVGPMIHVLDEDPDRLMPRGNFRVKDIPDDTVP